MKILLSGFYGEGNLGDETILRAILGSVPSAVSCVVSSASPPSLGFSRIKRRGLAAWLEFLSAAKQCGAVVFSGGILQDNSLEGVTFFALRMIAARLLGCKTGLWGAGLGPLRREGAKRLAARALRHADTAWLRDNYSAELFNALAGRGARLGADFSWYFNIERRSSAPGGGFIGLNLREWGREDFISPVKKLLRGESKKIIGLAARKSDIRAIKLAAPNALIVCPSAFEDFALACMGASCCVGMRYHAVLAMLRAGVGVRVCGYDAKVLEAAKEAGVKNLLQAPSNAYYRASQSFLSNNKLRFLQMQDAFKNWLEGV